MVLFCVYFFVVLRASRIVCTRDLCMIGMYVLLYNDHCALHVCVFARVKLMSACLYVSVCDLAILCVYECVYVCMSYVCMCL